MVETPELGRLDHERIGCPLGEAWNAGQDVEAPADVRVGLAQRFEAPLNGFDLAVDLAKPVNELALDEGCDGDSLAVEDGDAILDEGVTGVDQFRHGLHCLADGNVRLEFESRAHAGEHQGVAAVGLGEFACRLSEASGPPGIDLDPRQAGFDQRLLEEAMVSPCRLEHDARDREALEPLDEGAMAFRGVGDAEALALGVNRDVEHVFRNVEADASCYGWSHLFSVLVLSRGLDPRVSVQAAGKREGWSNYKSVPSDWRGHDPSPLAAGLIATQAGSVQPCRIRRRKS